MDITLKEIKSKSELKQFVKFNIEFYKNCPYHVPSIIKEEVGTLNKEVNPAFEFCESIYFMAFQDDKPVGRIAGIINRKVNEKWKLKSARFGWIDFIDDPAVSDALLDAVEKWAKEKGMTEINGPMGFSDMDHQGMLVEGFDQIGTMATIYNYPYYQDHLARRGYVKDAEWVEYKITVPSEIPEKHQRITEIVKKKYNFKIQDIPSNKALVQKYATPIFNLLNEAYSHLYGYSELSQKQIDYYTKMYISMVRLDLITIITDENDELIGFGISIPSLSEALRKSKGKLFPFGLLYLLKAMKCKNKIIDLYLIAIKPEYQNKGVNALLFSDLIPKCYAAGFEYAESNPELETNEKVQLQWQYFDRVQHKRRIAFIKRL